MKKLNTIKKIWKISTKDLISSYTIYIFILIFNTLFEILSLLYIFPLLDFLVLNQTSAVTKFFFEIINKFNLFSQKDEIFLVIVFFIAILIIKFFFNFLNIFYTQKLQLQLRKKLSFLLIERYLERQYRFFININSSTLIRNIFQEVPRFILGVATNIFNLFSEFILITSILLVLFVYDFKSTLVVFLLISFFGVIFLFFSKRLISSLAKKRIKFDGKYLKNIKEIFDNIKIIKISGTEKFFLNLARNNATVSFNSHFFYNIVAQSPRVIFELILIFIVFFVLIINISNDKIIYTLAIYSVSSLRLIPSISKVINSISNIRFDRPSLDIIFENIKPRKKVSIETSKNQINLNFKKHIQLKNINFSYNKKNKILDGINLSLKKNELTCLIGESGSGKSTLVDIISGILIPDSGNILIDNKIKINQKNINSWKNMIGYMPQSSNLLDMSIKDNITLGNYKNNKFDNFNLKKAIRDAELLPLIKKLNRGINTSVGDKGIKISGGEMQRVALARTLYSNSEIIILDEATSSLDVNTENKILKTLKKLKNKTILFITHRTNNLKNFNKIYKINNSKSYVVLKN